MIMRLMPGYKNLLGEPVSIYEEVLKNVPSELIIMLLINLNAELNSTESHADKQRRLLQLMMYRFNAHQKNYFVNAFNKYYQKTGGNYDGTIFGRRYLLGMMLKEFKRNHKCEVDYNDPIHEFDFFIAYLMIVDEINEEDSFLLEEAKKFESNEKYTLPLVWAAQINQYEFNESSNAAFELLKLLSFSKFAYDKHESFLKELVSKSNFQNLSQFIASFYQISTTTLNDNPQEPLRKLYFIKPQEGIDKSHLESQKCNFLLGNDNIRVGDFRKHPLFETDRGFMVIDENMYRKKMYKGPMFELHKQTNLKKEITFEDYKNSVSKECFEDTCFKGIVKSMVDSKYDKLHFDTGVSEPDLYYRNNKNIVLIEFKDYLFPDSLGDNSSFSEFKKYIDERFVASDREKPKGISQLINAIQNVINGAYAFDSQVNNEGVKKPKAFFPIICHTDFMFSMPGINEYLNVEFKSKVEQLRIKTKNDLNVTLINLEILFDYTLRGGSFIALIKLIERYWSIIKKRQEKLRKHYSINNFLATQASFDEVYETIFKKDFYYGNEVSEERQVGKISNIVGITQEQLNEVL